MFAIAFIVIFIVYLRIIFNGEPTKTEVYIIAISLAYQIYTMKGVYNHFKERKKLINDSFVQIVEVTLQPKIALKS